LTRFTVTDLPLTGLKLIERQRLGDARGFLSRLFCSDELTVIGWHKTIAQINHTFTSQLGTIRGLHFQVPPHAEMKLVSCIRGEVWDVVVDLRYKSPTFMQWHAQILSAQNGHALLIPEGFAHGFQTLKDDCELLYMHTEVYVPQAEAALRFNDERLDIIWPLPVAEISVRDQGHPLLTSKFNGIKLQ
jgi:dTDP-4-dehydrorhamnose 3,5-epimerase